MSSSSVAYRTFPGYVPMLEKFYRRRERLLNFTAFHMSNICVVDVFSANYPFDQIPLSASSICNVAHKIKCLQCGTVIHLRDCISRYRIYDVSSLLRKEKFRKASCLRQYPMEKWVHLITGHMLVAYSILGAISNE